MKSWHIGAIAGLIAGLASGIVCAIFINIGIALGLWGLWRPILSDTYGVNILLGTIWGLILGVIFSKAYDVIPSKGLLKGLFYGLILILIIEVRMSIWALVYGYFLDAAGYIFSGLFKWIVYGVILGFLYKLLHSRYHPIRELKIGKYSIGSGFFPGAIAGFVGGIATSFATIIGPLIGLQIIGAPPIPTFYFWISQAGTHILINLIWGIVFGMIFTKVYNLVPGKSVVKGFYYGMIVFLVTRMYDTYWLGWGLNSAALFAINTALWSMFVGFFNTFFFGIVLGYLYKPTK